MNNIWPPAPKGQPNQEPAASSPKVGLEAFVISCFSIVCIVTLRLIEPNPSTGSSPDNWRGPVALIGSVLLVVIWVTGFLLSILDWKTKFGPLAMFACWVTMMIAGFCDR